MVTHTLAALVILAGVSLTWDANSPIENVSQYRVYARRKHTNGAFVHMTSVATTAAILNNLSSARKYEFRVTAYNGQESGFSNAAYFNDWMVRQRAKVRGSIR